MINYIYFMFQHYYNLYIIYNVLFWGIYFYSTIKKIKDIRDDWIMVND